MELCGLVMSLKFVCGGGMLRKYSILTGVNL